MFTFSSRRSELPCDAGVVLLWGNHWWIGGRARPVPIENPEHPESSLLGAFADGYRPKKIRLVYQPDCLVSVPVPCPPGNRRIVQTALQQEYPALVDDLHAWSYEPVAKLPISTRTLLHYETEPALYALTAALLANGVEVVAAWPLASALNALPPEWPQTGAMTVVAVSETHAFIYRHAPDGTREVEVILPEQREFRVREIVQRAVAKSEVAFHLAALDAASREEVAPWLGSIEMMGWDDLMLAATTLSRQQSNQLLPASADVWLNRGLLALTASAVAGVVILGADIGRDVLQSKEDGALQATEVARLRGDIDALRKNEVEAARLSSEIAALAPGKPVVAELLRTVGRTLPPTAVLTRLQANNAGFEVSGGLVEPGLNEAEWRTWRTALESGRWSWANVADAIPHATFVFKGSFR